MDLQLQGRTVLITGGSRGIGKATALAFAAEGARVAVTYASDGQAARSLVETIEATGGEAAAYRMRLEDPSTIGEVVEQVATRFGSLDVLVAGAVVWPYRASGDLPTIDTAEWEDAVAANLFGTVATVRSALPHLVSAHGRIVLISSDVARKGLPGATAYATGKAGLAGFVAALKWEAGRAGVLANIVAPGFTMTESARERGDGPHGVLDRATQPSDVATAILFLGSFANQRITGSTLTVDGGESPA